MGISEIKLAIGDLSPNEKSKLFYWFAGLADLRTHHHQQLSEEIAIGVAQAENNKLAPLDIEAVKIEARERIHKGR